MITGYCIIMKKGFQTIIIKTPADVCKMAQKCVNCRLVYILLLCPEISMHDYFVLPNFTPISLPSTNTSGKLLEH